MTPEQEEYFNYGYGEVVESLSRGMSPEQIRRELLSRANPDEDENVIAFGNGGMTALLEWYDRKIY